jgi:hypothetical protein
VHPSPSRASSSTYTAAAMGSEVSIIMVLYTVTGCLRRTILAP